MLTPINKKLSDDIYEEWGALGVIPFGLDMNFRVMGGISEYAPEYEWILSSTINFQLPVSDIIEDIQEYIKKGRLL